MGQRFIKPFLFVAAFVMAAFSTNLLPVTAAGATGGNPGGNNGFVKVNGTKFDDIPNNEPHVGCKFRLEFYNYDRNSGHAQVQFELQSPTKGPGYSLAVTGGDLTPYIGADGNGGSNDLDADETYTLNFTGAPHPNQGYHVKLTVTAQGTNGNDTKHKVFWVQPCAKPVVDAQATACTDRPQGTGTVDVTVTNPNVTSVNYAVKLGAITQNITLAGGASQTVTFTGVAPGTYTVKVTGNNGTEKTTSVTVAECAPLQPTVTISDEVCSDPFSNIFTGSVKVTVENTNFQGVNYSVTLGGVTQNITLAAQTSGSVTFSGLQNGAHGLTVTGSNGTTVSKTVTIPACQPLAPQISAQVLTCTPLGTATGSAVVYIANPNTYAVTYQATIAGTTKSATIAAGSSQYIVFDTLSVGLHTVTVTGNNDTSATTQVEIEECPPAPVLPTLELTGPCIAAGTTGTIRVKVINNNNFDDFYVVTVGSDFQFVTVPANGSEMLTFSGLSVGSHTVTASVPGMRDFTSLSITLAACPVTTTPGQTLGTSTTRTVTTLPKTGANGSIGLLFALLATSVTYTVVLALQKRNFATTGSK